MFGTKWAKIIVVSVTTFSLLVALGITKSHARAARSRRAVFEQVWSIIATTYYDRDMNGLDWTGIRAKNEEKLRNVKDSFGLYWNILIPMTSLLESSHVQIMAPAQRRLDAFGRPLAIVPRGQPESCAGLWLTNPRRQLSTRVKRVDPNSLLYAAGVRTGWRLVGIAEFSDDQGRAPTISFTSTAGEDFEIPIKPKPGDRAIDIRSLKSEFVSLNHLLLTHADPATELTLDTLGVVVSIGQAAVPPRVVDVENDSAAEKAGIEPGSVITRFRIGPGPNGEDSFSANLQSPAGAEYSARFSYRTCDGQSPKDDRASRQLGSGVLYIRFDSFRPDVAGWLDDQLRAAPRGLVLDLRHNRGGDVTILPKFLGRFLPPGARIAEAVYPDHSEAWAAAESQVAYKGPVAVLVGPLSASAAEITANALRFHRRATLHGQKTSGSVLVSYEFPLDDGGAVQVAVADVRGPDGQRLERVGVDVDRIVAPTLSTVRAGRDVVLESAIGDLASHTN